MSRCWESNQVSNDINKEYFPGYFDAVNLYGNIGRILYDATCGNQW